MALYSRSQKQPQGNSNSGLVSYQSQQNQKGNEQQQKTLKKMNESAVLLLHYLTHQNIASKLRLGFSKMKKHQKDSNQRCLLMIAILKSLLKRKNNDHLRAAFSNVQSESISRMISQKKSLDERKKTAREKATLILVSILNNLQKIKVKDAFIDLSKRIAQKRLISCYRTTLLYGTLKRIVSRKQKEGWSSLSSQNKKFTLKKKGLLKLNNIFINRESYFKSNVLALVRLIGAKRLAAAQAEKQEKSVTPSVSRVQPNPVVQEVQNIYVEQYKKLQIEFESLQASHEAVIQEYKNQIQNLQIKNDGLKFNYEFLESENMELEKQIMQSQQKLRKKVSMKEVWQQIYKNLLFFLSKNIQASVSRQELLSVLEIPLVKINYSVDSLNQENQILKELIEEYGKVGMHAKTQAAIEQTPGKIVLSQYPFDVILKCNKYYYDIVDVLAEKGLGRISQVDAFKQQLENFISKASEVQQK